MSRPKETFNKKEKEKQKSRQRQEKKEKMEERKSNKKKLGLEDMMAYIDENGNLSDTPPDPNSRRIFKQDDIQIGVPKQVPQEYVPHTGTVTFFNHAKGFGFINDEVSKERVFFHVNDIREQLEEGDKVTFDVEHGHRGLSATNVSKLS